MALAAIISEQAFNELADPIKAEYKKRDGKDAKGYILDVTDVDGFALENVTGLKSALAKERDAKDKAEKKVEVFKDIDPDTARDAMSKVAEMDGWDKDEKTKQLVEAEKKKLIEKHASEMKAKDDREGVLTKALRRALVDSAATTAIADAKGSVDLLLPIVKKFTKLEENEGEFVVRVLDDDLKTNRITRETGKTDPMGVSEFVSKVLKEDERFRGGFGGSGSSGPGGKTSTKERETGAGGGRTTTEEGGVINPVENLRAARRAAAAAEE